MRRLVLLVCAAAAQGCAGEGGRASPEPPASDSLAPPDERARGWNVDTLPGVVRLRPGGMSDPVTVWGIERGRLARLRLESGTVERRADVAWDVSAARGTVAWRNENGTWWLRDDRPTRVASGEPVGEFESPPEILLAGDGSRAVLSWRAEWSLHHELLAADGSRQVLSVRLPGHMAHGALLWLDSTRILFSAVAIAPRGGAPEYRESGWRGDLAVLDLGERTFRRVTDVPDGRFLRPAGLYRGRVLTAEHDDAGVREYWLYDPVTWVRDPFPLPPGRAFAAGQLCLLFVVDTVATAAMETPPADGGDHRAALLLDGGTLIRLGTAADPDLAPVFAPDGRSALLRIYGDRGLRLLRIHARDDP